MFRLVLPIIAVTLLATAAKDPNNLWHLYEYFSTWYAADVRAWIEQYNSLIQTIALGISFFVGSPILVNIKNFVQGKLRT